MRMGRFFGTSAEFWMGLQADDEMAVARDGIADDLAAIKPWRGALSAA
jgi:plasmid maintenance system antidote protein VapI